MQLIDRHEVHVCCFDDISLLDHHVARSAVNWRPDRAIFQLQLRAIERGLIGGDVRLHAVDRGVVGANPFGCRFGLRGSRSRFSRRFLRQCRYAGKQ